MNKDSDQIATHTALRNGPSWSQDLRLLLLIAGPNVITTIAHTAMSFVDYAIVSQLGSAAQAAVSSAGMIFFCIFGFVLGLLVCVTTVVSQSLGVGRLRDCSAYAWQGIWLSLLFGLIGIALWPLVPALFDLIGHEPRVQVMEVGYTRIRLLGMWAAGSCVAIGYYFNGIHRPHLNAISVVGANVFNAVISYGLVFGKWGLPVMGVEGAALGTVVSNVLRLVWLWWLMCCGRSARPFHARATWRLDFDKLGRLYRIGWPVGLAFVADIGAWAMLLVVIIGLFGTTHIAAAATCWRYIELSFMPAIGIGIAVCTVVGKAIGSGRCDLARRRAFLGAVINMTYMGLMGVVFVVFGTPMIRLFSDEPEVVRLGAQLLICAAVFQLFDAIAISYNNALRGAGDTRWPSVVWAILAWTIMVGGGWYMATYHPEFGAIGPWLFATGFVIVIGLALWGRWRIGSWEEIDVLGREETTGVEFDTVTAKSGEAIGSDNPGVASDRTDSPPG